jgi:hypothetical protein
MFDDIKKMFDQGNEGKDKKPIDDFGNGEQEPEFYNYETFVDDGGDEFNDLWERFDPIRPDTEGPEEIEFVVEFNNLDDLNNYLDGTPESVLRVYAFEDEDGEPLYDVYRYDS